MNEAEKCPVCRSDGRKERGREDGEYVAYYVCDTCMFMCGLEDLPRIAAAMEMARSFTDNTVDLKTHRMLHERVLEVFGK